MISTEFARAHEKAALQVDALENAATRAARTGDVDGPAEPRCRGEPFFADRGEAGAPRPERQHRVEAAGETWEQNLRADRPSQETAQIRGGVGEARRRDRDVHAEADDGREAPPRRRDALDQEAGQLGAVRDEIVRPFQ